MHRRTKIVCTLGPSTSDREAIEALVEAGMDVARLNFSHGNHAEHRQRIEHVRAAAEAAGRAVPILQDLQGPKIRIGQIEGGAVDLEAGQELILTTAPVLGNRRRIQVDHAALPSEVDAGGSILLDDGLLELRVLESDSEEVRTEVVIGGELHARKGVNLPNSRASRPPLTEKDEADLAFGLELDVDLMALSFVRSASDVEALTERIRAAGRRVSVIAKIEKPEAVDHIDAVIEAADGVMVARGDLGIEMPMARVPSVQKMIIHKCLGAARPVITATQMLESMIENPRPTRAEASDVANAVLDGSDALMLSGETAVGRYPTRVVQMMSRIIEEAEGHREQYRIRLDQPPGALEPSENITESVSFTACRLAEQVGARAIACLTNSGAT